MQHATLATCTMLRDECVGWAAQQKLTALGRLLVTMHESLLIVPCHAPNLTDIGLTLSNNDSESSSVRFHGMK